MLKYLIKFDSISSGVPRLLSILTLLYFKMMEMRTKCERCEATLLPHGVAYICSYECSYCESCTEQLEHVCPNCQGELVRRPRRKQQDESTEN